MFSYLSNRGKDLFLTTKEGDDTVPMTLITVRLDNGTEALVELTDKIEVGETVFTFVLNPRGVRDFKDPHIPVVITKLDEAVIIHVEHSTRTVVYKPTGSKFVWQISGTYGTTYGEFISCVSSVNPIPYGVSDDDS